MEEGFPPGWHFKTAEERGYKTEQQRRNEKQQKAIQEVNKILPGNIKAVPVDYDSDGIPIIEDAPQSASPMPMPQQPAQVYQPQSQQVHQPQQRKVVHQPMEPQVQQPTVKDLSPPHPVIQKMLSKFGLKKIEKYKLDLMSHDGTLFTYTMISVPDELSLWCLDEAKQKAVVEGENPAMGWFQLLLSCASVVAIDGEPLWKIFNIQPSLNETDDLTKDPLDVSLRIRKQTTIALAKYLWSDMSPIGDKLYEFYEGKIVASSKVVSSWDKEMEGASRFVCPFDGCTDYAILKPQMSPEGHELPYFCRIHGEALIKAVSLRQESSIPLG